MSRISRVDAGWIGIHIHYFFGGFSWGFAQENGIPAWVGGMLESSLGRGINLELATLENFVYPNDIGPSSRSIKEDITDPVLEFPGKEKTFTPSTVPGVPYLPNREKLKKSARYKFSLSHP